MKKILFLSLFTVSTLFCQTPGGVSTTNMSLWLSGDNEITEGVPRLTWGTPASITLGYDVYQEVTDSKPTQAELFNFHNTFTFDGDDDFFAIESLNYTTGATLSDLYAFVVYKTDFSDSPYDSNWSFIDFDRSEAYDFYIHGDGRLAMSYNNSSNVEVDLTATTPSNNDIPHIGSFIFDNTTDNDVKFRLDGIEDFSVPIATDISIQSDRFGFIGDGSEANSENGTRNNKYYDGEIAEVILFDKGAITATEVLQIESYLALKYGITLDSSLAGTGDSGDYIYNDGTTTTTIWDASVAAGYHNNVAGLIRADNYSLHQKIAKSVGNELIVSKDADYISSNDTGRSSIGADGDYLMFGNNGETGLKASTILNVADGEFYDITKSTWLFKEGTDIGAVNFAIPINFFRENTDVQMVVSSDDVFETSPTDTHYSSTINGDYYEFNVNISDGEYIAFIATADKLAGISLSKFDMVLRADDTSLIGSDLSLNDLSFGEADGYQDNLGRIPNTSSLMNFNPTLTFDGTSDLLYIKNKNYTATQNITNIHAFTVFSTSYVDTGAFDNWSFIDFDRSESYNMYIHGDGRLAFSYQSGGTKDLYSESLGNDGLPHIAEFVFDANVAADVHGLTRETQMKFDGNVEFNSDLTNANILVKSNRYGFVGDGSESATENAGRNNIYYDGKMSEIILADREAFTANETLQIESYLAIKYGITLHPSLLSYKNSSGIEIWNNQDYWNGIAGIINDTEDSYLDQRIAQSTSAQDLILSTDADFINSNLSHTTVGLDLDDSLLFGNNGSGTGYTNFTGGASDEYITARKWLFKELGTIGTVFVAIPKSYFPSGASAIEYIISTNDIFTAAEELPVIALTDSGDFWSFSRDIADGERLAFTFTLAAVPSPAAIETGLNMWIKSDKNVVSATNIISSIGDSSLNPHDVSQGTNLDKPRFENTGYFNFNPSIFFDGEQDHFAVNDLNFTTTGEISKMYAWVVYKTESTDTNNGSFLSFDGNEYFDISVEAATGNLGFSFASTAADSDFVGTTETNDGNIKIAGFIQDNTLTNSSVIRLNGDEELANNTNPNAIGKTGATRFGFVGDLATATTETFDEDNSEDFYDGNIAEIVYYQDETIVPTDITKIETYLAIKYGVTIAGDYLIHGADIGVDPDITIWDATTNAAYHNNIAGIGLDEESELNQKQSSSAEEGNILTISIEDIDPIAITNEENLGSFADNLDFLVWGNNAVDDNLSLEQFGGVLPGICETVFKKLDRDWKISNIGGVGSVDGVTISFDLSTIPIPISGFSLMIDSDGDGDFGTGSPVEIIGTLTGTTLVFTGVTLAHNDVISLKTTSPVSIVTFNNGLWSGGSGTNEAIDNSATDLLKSLEVASDLTITDNINCRCLTTGADVEITVNADKILKVSHTLDNNGSMFLYDDAQLIQTAANTNTTTGNLYQVIDELTSSAFNYNYVSSPVHNESDVYTIAGNLKFNTDALDITANTNPSFTAVSYDGSGTTLSSRWFYTFNSLDTYVKIDESTALKPGVGFTMKGTETSNRYNFIGVPNNGDMAALTLTTGEFAIVGNPYPSALDADDFIEDLNADSDVIGGTIYFWDQRTATTHYSADYDGAYATRIFGVGAPAAGVTTASVAPTNIIKPGQGFIVTGGTTAGLLTFTNDMRVDDNTSINGSQFYKTATKQILKPVIRLGFEFDNNGNTNHRQLVTIPNGGKLAHDKGKDAPMFDSFKNDAYWLVKNEENRYVITTVPNITNDLELPIGVAIDLEKEVLFKLDTVENISSTIYLLDKKLNTLNNITTNSYSTVLEEGNHKERFSLVFKKEDVLGLDAFNDNYKVVTYTSDKNLNVILESENIEEIELYNLLGKKVMTKVNFIPKNNITTNIENLPSQIYILKIKVTGKTIVRKIFME